MQISYLKVALPAVLLLSLSGCIDKDYDLSNIDTTSQVSVKDLTLPINVDAITLDDVINFDDNEKFSKVTDNNGNEFYAFTQKDKFSSDPIFINKVTAKAPTLNPTTSVIRSTQQGSGSIVTTSGVTLAPISYEITKMANNCSFTATDVDNALLKITSAKTSDVTFKITLEAKGVSDFAQKSTFTDLKFQLIKGMTTKDGNGSYDAETGIWTISNYETTANTSTFSLTVTGFDFEKSGAVLNTGNHTFTLPGEVSVLSGTLMLTPKANATVPNELDFEASYALDDFAINSFCGRLNYRLNGLTIAPFELTDIPEFLSGDGTNLFLSNPQIYLTTNNPVAGDNLQCRFDLALTARRPSKPSIPDFTYSPSTPVTIGHDLGVDGPYNFVLAPKPGIADINILDSKYATNLNPVLFPDLSKIVSTPTEYSDASLPDLIDIAITDAEIVESDVTDFELGRNIVGMKGSFDFVAPLSLADGSTVIYTKVDDGWNSETVDGITISQIVISAKAVNQTPLAVSLKAYPLDVDGNRIEGVSVIGTQVDAGAVDEPVTITLDGTITHLDGARFVATLLPDGTDTALAPSQTVTLKDVRVTVSGNLIKEL